MLKKFGMVTVGVTAGLLAVAPLASASEGHDHHDKGHDKGHHKSHDRGDAGSVSGDQEGTSNIQCGAASGNLDNDATGEGLVGIGQVAGPVASGNAGQLLSCNSFLNDFLNDNSVSVGVLGDAVAS